MVIVGPARIGIAERAGTRVEGMSAEEYIRQSILEPAVFIVPDFEDAADMPVELAGELSAQQLEDLIAYLMTK